MSLDVILFDAGGVLVELTGVETMRALLQHRVTVDELWKLWLSSPAVRDFERGRIDATVVEREAVRGGRPEVVAVDGDVEVGRAEGDAGDLGEVALGESGCRKKEERDRDRHTPEH